MIVWCTTLICATVNYKTNLSFEKWREKCILESIKFDNHKWYVLRTKKTTHIYVAITHCQTSVNNLVCISHNSESRYLRDGMSWHILNSNGLFSFGNRLWTLSHSSYLFFFFLMVKMSFRNVFSIFKSEVTNCGPQPTVLNIKKLRLHSCFPGFLICKLLLQIRSGRCFHIVAVSSQVVTGSQLKEASSFLCPLSSTPVFPVLIHITHISYLHPHLAPTGLWVCNSYFQQLE